MTPDLRGSQPREAAPVGCLFCPAATPSTATFDDAARRCLACGFLWSPQAAIPSVEVYDADYYAGGGYEDYFLSSPRSFEAQCRIDWLQPVLDTVDSLLEVGCAAGYFVAAAQRHGLTASGVEVSPAAVGYARDQLGVAVAEGLFEEVQPTLPRVDLVAAFHVLEHVGDPRRFLATARSALGTGGWLAIEVPNAESPAARRLGTRWPALQPEYHRWHFGPESLTRLLAAAGFDMVALDTVPFRSYMPRSYRWRHARHLLPADVRSMRSLRLSSPTRGDLLRVIARTSEVRLP